MGIFLGLLPDAEALASLGHHPRPEVDGVRWEPDDRLHVTLRYTASVHEEIIAQLDEVAQEVASRTSAPIIELGPATELLGRDGTLVVPAHGAEDLARLVDRVLDEFGVSGAMGSRDHPFYGHMTVARRRRTTTIPAELVGVAVSTVMEPSELVLIVSEPGPDGSVYDHRVRAAFS